MERKVTGSGVHTVADTLEQREAPDPSGWVSGPWSPAERTAVPVTSTLCPNPLLARQWINLQQCVNRTA